MIRWIILMAVIFIMLRILLQLFPGLLNLIGRLPGDSEFTSGEKKVQVPITTMIILSLIITIILNFLQRIV